MSKFLDMLSILRLSLAIVTLLGAATMLVAGLVFESRPGLTVAFACTLGALAIVGFAGAVVIFKPGKE